MPHFKKKTLLDRLKEAKNTPLLEERLLILNRNVETFSLLFFQDLFENNTPLPENHIRVIGPHVGDYRAGVEIKRPRKKTLYHPVGSIGLLLDISENFGRILWRSNKQTSHYPLEHLVTLSRKSQELLL
jgi:hypothetical protein